MAKIEKEKLCRKRKEKKTLFEFNSTNKKK